MPVGPDDDLLSLVSLTSKFIDPGVQCDNWQARGIDVRSFSVVSNNLASLWYRTALQFIGFYLPSPNHDQTDSTQWVVALDDLRQMGWGLAILYVGQQEPDNDKVRQVRGGRRLAHDMTRGALDGADAIKQMTPFFPRGSTVFLDIESHQDATLNPDGSPGPNFGNLVPPPDPHSPEGPGNPPGLHSPGMVQYATDWVRALLVSGNYMPGIYCFGGAASQLRDAFAADPEIASLLPPAGLRFWVVGHEEDDAGNEVQISNDDFENRCDLNPGRNFWFPPAELWQTLCPTGACARGPNTPDTNYRGIVADRDVSTLIDPSAP